MSDHIPSVLSIEGAATQRLPIVFDSPHSGTRYPDDFDHIADMALLRNAEDTHVQDLWAGVAPAGGVLLHAHFPRSYVDANRAADDMQPDQIEGRYPLALNPSVKSQLGIGLCWTRVPPDGGPLYARRLGAQEVHARVMGYHQPYHDALRRLLDGAWQRWGAVWHVNCHSMQQVASAMSTQQKGTPRPDFVLGDRDGTSSAPEFTHSIRQFLVARGYVVAVNDPYKGMELIRANGAPSQRRHSMQIEVNRALYMDERTRLPNEGYAALQATFSDLARHIADFAQTRLETCTT